MKEYAYTTGTLGTATATHNYGYGTADSNPWRDRLMDYKGQAIAYDGAGNPTSYLGKTLTWENGRQLATVGNNIRYEYTLDGTRLAKTVGNTRTEYTLDGNLIVRETVYDITDPEAPVFSYCGGN